MGLLVLVGLLVSIFVCFAHGISAPEYPGQPQPAWVEHLWIFTARWMWWWGGVGVVPCLSGVVTLVLPRAKVTGATRGDVSP
ncbi:hypothetical protein BH10ACT10_BH10ACT10_17370 [soil metagenome]